MSAALYPIWLEWAQGRGLARYDGVQVELRRPPSGHAEVHFVPGIQCDVRDHASDARREMTPAERRGALLYLHNLARAQREHLGDDVRPLP